MMGVHAMWWILTKECGVQVPVTPQDALFSPTVKFRSLLGKVRHSRDIGEDYLKHQKYNVKHTSQVNHSLP